MANTGKLVVITGPMFSGKTTKLITEIYNARKKNRSAVILKSAIDIRYSKSDVVSHDGLKLPAMILPDGADCVPALYKIAEKYDVIGIDEGHFWDGTPGLVAALDELAFDSKTIYISMLNRKNIGTPFDMSKDLLPLADRVYSLAAKCSKCGRKAAFTQRITEYKTGGMQRFVGGAGDYEPRCRAHFIRPSISNQRQQATAAAQPKIKRRARIKLKLMPLPSI